MQITPMIWFCIIVVSTLIVMIPYYIISLSEKKRKSPSEIFADIGQSMIDEPFSVSSYYARIEKTSLDILDAKKPVDQIIILWWGLDGLRLNEDGELEWISRKKPEPVNQNVFYQTAQKMEQAIAQVSRPFDYSMCQSTQAQINALQAQNTALQMQAAQQAQNMAMMAALQSYIVPYPTYPDRGIGGSGGTGGYVTYYSSQLGDCCCARTISGKIIRDTI